MRPRCGKPHSTFRFSGDWPFLLPRPDDLNRNVLLTVGQLPKLLGQGIKGDGSLVLGVFMDNQFGELLLGGLLTG